MGAHAQGFGHTFPTARTLLTGERGWHGDDSTPGPCCLGFEDGPKRRPARIADAFGEVVIADQVGDLQVFEIDRIVGSEQRERRLVVEVAALSLHLLAFY